ncbi:endo alpha-1,4 polygalactosaminidase [Brevibacterium salitolerans]|uniref:Endo alpha-1,4 polygalactosaminidase n=1 Tax=Brevibacterium salitolerans TaxID=1403566 RepID=A0ABN2WQR6_9MICO
MPTSVFALPATLVLLCGLTLAGCAAQPANAPQSLPSHSPQPAHAQSSDASGTAPEAGPSQTAASANTASVGTAPAPGAFALPPTTGVFDYQLGGAHPTADGRPLDVVVRDASAAPQPGAYSVCYVNAFQTQPDESAEWLARDEERLRRGSAPLLLRTPAGEPVRDPDWPDEYVLDPSAEEQRDGILEHLAPVITACADDGFDAVEFDNLDTWTRFPAISEAGAGALARSLTAQAHAAGMAAGQKNAAEVAATAQHDLGFDFAVTEECAVWDECRAYTDVYGEHVLQIEYPDALAEAGLTFAEACAAPGRAPLTLLRDRGLTPPGDEAHVYAAC